MEGLGFIYLFLPLVHYAGVTHTLRELDLKPQSNVSFSSNLDQIAVFTLFSYIMDKRVHEIFKLHPSSKNNMIINFKDIANLQTHSSMEKTTILSP